MDNKKIPRIGALVAIIAAVAFVAAVAYLVLGAPGTLGYRTIFDSLRTLAEIGAVAAIVSAVIFVLALRSDNARATVMAGIAALLFAGPVVTMIINEASPPPGELINDITTDLNDPPAFSAVIPLREPDSNPIEYGGAEVAAVQRAVHPEVAPILTSLAAEAAFQRAFETAEAMGWEIVAGDPRTGIIEAVDTTTFFRFKDDIVIRVRPTATGSRVDLRSRSRIGRSDLGKNAARIVEYSEAFEGSS
jgi:uncharacterized protein (DUF1499 family)